MMILKGGHGYFSLYSFDAGAWIKACCAKVLILSLTTVIPLSSEAFNSEEPVLEKTATKESVTSVDTSVQTGETKLELPDSTTGETTKATAFVDGQAPEAGTVVVDEEGKEIRAVS